MDIKELQVIIEDKFKNDPLREQIIISNLSSDLYPENLLEKLNVNMTYSLSQAAEILGVRDHNLRNYLNRHDLDAYIVPERIGKLYRLDYISVFKFHMIFLLVKEGNRTPTDISSYVGTSPQVSKVSKKDNKGFRNVINETNVSPESLDYEERFEKIEKKIILMEMQRRVNEQRSSYENAKREVIDWENKISLLGIEIENLELKKQLKKQQKSTQELVKETHKKIGSESQVSTGFSLKNIFSRGKQTSINYDKVIDETISQVNSQVSSYSPDEAIEENLKKLREELKELQNKKEPLLETKNVREKEFLELENKYKQLELSLSKSNNEQLLGYKEEIH